MFCTAAEGRWGCRLNNVVFSTGDHDVRACCRAGHGRVCGPSQSRWPGPGRSLLQPGGHGRRPGSPACQPGPGGAPAGTGPGFKLPACATIQVIEGLPARRPRSPPAPGPAAPPGSEA
jgi:hypothetical protein